MFTTQTNIAAQLKGAYVCQGSATAAGTGDATKITGATIDRDNYLSAALELAYTTTLTATKTLAFAVEVQESSDGSTWDTATVIQASTVAATATGTSTGVVQIADNLWGRKKYVRYNVTPDLSNTATDTATFAAIAVLGGAHTVPAA